MCWIRVNLYSQILIPRYDMNSTCAHELSPLMLAYRERERERERMFWNLDMDFK
jgi:hypothetical protein